MRTCPHCKGTGKAPIKLPQECCGCQKKVTLTFDTHAEMIRHDGRVYCADCQSAGPQASRDGGTQAGFWAKVFGRG